MSNSPPIALLPCPFCGPGNSCVQCYENDAGRFQVGCGACGSHSGSHKIDKYAIASWNTRAHPTPDRMPSRDQVKAGIEKHYGITASTDYILQAIENAGFVIAAMGDFSTRKDEDVDCRGAFEKWASLNSNYAKPDRVMENQAWLGWQASWDERNNIAKGQGRSYNSAAMQSPASDIGTLQIGPGPTTICQKCMAKWEECRCEISVVDEKPIKRLIRDELQTANTESCDDYSYHDGADDLYERLRPYLRPTEPVPFKSGDTHCDDCPCRYGQHLKPPEPVSVSLAEMMKIYDDTYQAIVVSDDPDAGCFQAEEAGVKAVLDAAEVKYVD